jgi:hypothetical protein
MAKIADAWPPARASCSSRARALAAAVLCVLLGALLALRAPRASAASSQRAASAASAQRRTAPRAPCSLLALRVVWWRPGGVHYTVYCIAVALSNRAA